MKKLVLLIGLLLVLSTAVYARGAIRDVVVKTTMTDAMKMRVLQMQAFEAQRAAQSARVKSTVSVVPPKSTPVKGLIKGLAGQPTVGIRDFTGKTGAKGTTFTGKYERTKQSDYSLKAR